MTYCAIIKDPRLMWTIVEKTRLFVKDTHLYNENKDRILVSTCFNTLLYDKGYICDFWASHYDEEDIANMNTYKLVPPLKLLRIITNNHGLVITQKE